MSRLRLVGAVEIQPTRLVSRSTFAGIDLGGVREGGTFVMVQSTDALGLLRGTIQQPGLGNPQPGVLATADTAPFADVSRADGRVLLAGRPGVATKATARDPVSGNGGDAAVTVTEVQTPATFTLTLGVVAPGVIATSPTADAVDVPLDSTVMATFSEAIDESSVTPQTFAVRNGTTDVPGTRTLSADRLRVTFRPDAQLAGNTTHTLTISDAIRDLTGNGPATTLTVTFRTLDPSEAAAAVARTDHARPARRGRVRARDGRAGCLGSPCAGDGHEPAHAGDGHRPGARRWVVPAAGARRWWATRSR